MKFLEKTLFPVLTRLGENRHLRAIRDGIVAILPLIVTGSFFLLLGQLPGSGPQADWGPVEAWLNQTSFTHAIFQWYVANHGIFLIPYLLTMKLMSLYAVFTISASLAKIYGTDPVSSGLIGVASLLLTLVPVNVEKQGWMLPLSQLGGASLFLAIIIGLLSAEVYRFSESRNFIRLPEGVPPSVARAFSSVIPLAALVTFFWVIRHVLGIDLQSWILVILSPIEKLGDSLIAVILITLVVHLIWLAGIHGVSVMNALFLSLWIYYLDQNAQAVAAGHLAPYVTAHPFYQWFVWVGGSGATLGLAFLLLFSRSKSLKDLGKLSFLPSLCNINEPIIFGLPIMLNPIMAIPFLLAPTVAGVIAYLAFKWNFVNRPFIWVPWTLPAPIGAFLSTGYDWRALVLLGIIVIVTTLIYYPFLKQLERKTGGAS